MDIKELNAKFMQKKNSNPENNKNKPLNDLKSLAEQCFKKAQEMPKTASKQQENDKYKEVLSKFHFPSRYKKADLKDFGFTDSILIPDSDPWSTPTIADK